MIGFRPASVMTGCVTSTGRPSSLGLHFPFCLMRGTLGVQELAFGGQGSMRIFFILSPHFESTQIKLIETHSGPSEERLHDGLCNESLVVVITILLAWSWI